MDNVKPEHTFDRYFKIKDVLTKYLYIYPLAEQMK